MTDPATDDEETSSVPRRRLLATTGLAATGLIAGCGGNGDGDSGADDPTTTSAPETTATSTPPPTTTSTTTPTAEPELTDSRDVLTAPSSHIHPLDGWANADWLVEDADDIQIIKVTSLGRSGPGTLQRALHQEGPRIIVFEVGGVIDLRNQYEDNTLQVKPVETSRRGRDLSRAFVAGQTAPSPGITIIRGELSPYARDCIFQHVRIRCGDEAQDALDTVSIGSVAEDCIVDHCSVSWGTDENLSIDGDADVHRKTISNNIVAEGLYDSIHPKGPHSMGSLIKSDQREIAVLGNLYAHHDQRHPRLKGGLHGAVVNNFVYNFGVAIGMGGEGESPATATIEANHWRAGEATSEDTPIVHPDTGAAYEPRAYVADNLREPDSIPVIGDDMEQLEERPYWPETLSPVPAEELADAVLPAAGARPAERTPHDERVVADARNREGSLIDSQEEVGGYPDFETTERTLDPPEYGPEFADWLAQHTRAVELGEEPPSS